MMDVHFIRFKCDTISPLYINITTLLSLFYNKVFKMFVNISVLGLISKMGLYFPLAVISSLVRPIILHF